MKSALISLSLLFTLTGWISGRAQAAQPNWRIDPEASSVKFHIKNMGMSVDGKFAKVTGLVNYDGKNLAAASVQANVDTGSIDTGIGPRDSHLKTKDFFDAAKFPEAEFRSSKIEVKPSGDFQITGNFSLHGVSKVVTLEAAPLTTKVYPSGEKHLVASASTKLLRKDFGIGGLAAMTVGNDVTIDLTIDLVKN
jgi:polyisoprenoid-binding protein YceI